MHRTFQILFIALLCLSPVVAKPTKPMVAKAVEVPKAKTLPHLEGPSNWGHVTHIKGSRSFSLHGHPLWDGEGVIRESDGKVVVIWTNLNSMEIGPGVYEIVIVEGVPEMHGEWGYTGNVQIDDKGNIGGATSRDRVFRVVPPMGPDL